MILKGRLCYVDDRHHATLSQPRAFITHRAFITLHGDKR